MPIANSRLERIQLKKLLQCVINGDIQQIEKHVKYGVPNLINYNDPDDGITPLISTVKQNDLKTLKHLLKFGANTDIVDFEGRTALMRAAEDGKLDIFQALMSAGANKNISDLEGKSVLFHCIFPSERHFQCLKLLMDKQVDINKEDNSKELALHVACKKSKEHEIFILELLNNGADPNKPSKSGRTPLLEICASGSLKALVHAVTTRAGNITVTDNRGRTPVHEAAKNGHLEILVALYGFGAVLDVYDQDGVNPLHLAATKNEMCCKYLGQRGCNPKAKDKDGNLPRNVATNAGQKACVKELRKLEHTFGKPQKNTEAWALYLYDWAISNTPQLRDRFTRLGQYLAIEMEEQARQNELALQPTDEDTNGVNKEPITAVTNRADLTSFRSISEKSTSSSKTSRKRKSPEKNGEIPNELISTDLIPITRLPYDDFYNVLQVLSAPLEEENLNRLIKLHEKNGDGCIEWEEFLTGKKYINKAYLMSAFAGKKEKKKKGGKGGKGKKVKIPMDICILPKESILRRADGGPPIMFIPRQVPHTDPSRFNADSQPIHLLQDDSAWYLNAPRRQYISFHAAAKHNDLPSIRLALSEGYHVDTRDKFYKTPLMVAAHHGNLDSAIALIKLGADVNAKDNFHWTPLHHAAHSGMIDLVELLLHNGATIESKAMNGGTPLFRAIECSRLNVVDYLMAQGAKVIVENSKGDNPYDVALAWADPRVIEHVHDKWELAQELAERNKKQGSSKGKRPVAAKSSISVKGANNLKDTLTPPAKLPGSRSKAMHLLDDISNMLAHSRPLDIAVAANDLRICPRYRWLPLPSRTERLARLAEARERYGWDHGLPGVPPHLFDQHLADKLADVEAEAG
ncbi:Ankyrin repeat and EF-hand domain-containing protein 1 [Paragonimus heterotremus]|uniref:Ankyrin repeat and EF-hand domain-containing protein 1 n=1 Tax=Paragonimus heterotremus TaxID=100268 RepID=A0A8J4WRG3_9TREM|nr:Ankyrin repeat and EF-hand domain-containing protein 1 [Paragonimus heterotremus]